jgi:hypothetical protein
MNDWRGYLDYVHETDCTAAEAVGTLLAMQKLIDLIQLSPSQHLRREDAPELFGTLERLPLFRGFMGMDSPGVACQ